MKRIYAVVFLATLFSVAASAGPIPAGYVCTGTCASDGADGVVTLSPTGNPTYLDISTSGGLAGVGIVPGGPLGVETNGSMLQSPIFSANAGDPLNFYFNYVTSDGGGFADYAWAALYDPLLNPVALLLTARTQVSGSIIPGFSMPATSPGVTLTPASVPIIPGGPAWTPLGGYSGTCWSGGGCGYTGWVLSTYNIPSAGNYILQFGVTNWSDTQYDSGLAIDGVTVAGVPVSDTPEPGTLGLLGLGLGAIGIVARQRKLR